MSRPLVVSVILNTNRREDTIACLESLQANDYEPHRILVLDNASTDGSVQAIRSTFPQVEIIELLDNFGYAGNNNVGINVALGQGADWIFILNEDVVLEPDTVSRLLALGTRDPKAGVLGPLVYHYDEPNVIQSAGGTLDDRWLATHRGQNEQDRGQYSQIREVEWISGCAIMVRRAVIEQVGVLDARFFYYWEETEWCLRARKSGWKILFDPRAKIWHKGVQRDYSPSPNITYYWTRNWLLTLAKHQAPARAWMYALGSIARNLLAWSVRRKWRIKRDHRDAMWQGMLDFIRRRWGMRPA